MAASYCTCMAWGVVPPRVSGVVLAPWAFAVCLGPCASRSRTHRARRRLVGDPSSGELVGDVANWPKIGEIISPSKGVLIRALVTMWLIHTKL
jgi:hypothetical protein